MQSAAAHLIEQLRPGALSGGTVHLTQEGHDTLTIAAGSPTSATRAGCRNHQAMRDKTSAANLPGNPLSICAAKASL